VRELSLLSTVQLNKELTISDDNSFCERLHTIVVRDVTAVKARV